MTRLSNTVIIIATLLCFAIVVAYAHQEESYKPPLAYHLLTPFYDALVGLTCREDIFRPALISQANVLPENRVLEVGCGTGSLSLALKMTAPESYLTCFDPDQESLDRAASKFESHGYHINRPGVQSNDDKVVTIVQGFGQAMPFPDQSFDCVISSLMFHHLNSTNKLKTLQEMKRVLKPGGKLHIADWGAAYRWYERTLFLTVQLLDGFETTADNVEGMLPLMMQQAEFLEVSETQRILTPLGILSLYTATRPFTSNVY